MSAANSASQPVRRGVPSAAQRPGRSATQPTRVGFAPKETEAEFKLNLADIPREQQTLDVEGFKPSLLSRLLDLVSPMK